MKNSGNFAAHVLALLAFATVAIEANAQPQSIPGGSYRNSCSNLQVRSDRGRSLSLFAVCTDRDGRYVQSSIPLPCDSAENDNGQLKCVVGGIPPEFIPPPVPDGTYRNSCFDLSVRKDRDNKPVLIAKCTDRRGTVIQSTLYLPCQGDVANENGWLTCDGIPASGPAYQPTRLQPPPGTYLGSCTDVVVQYQPGRRGVLFATCSSRQGARIQSSIYLPCTGKIENDDGRLKCED